MKKKEYLKATFEVIEFRAEKGFAASADTESYTDGGSFTWDGNGGTSGNNASDGGYGNWDF